MSKSQKYRVPLEPDITVAEYAEWLFAGASLYEREALKMTNPQLRHVHRTLAESRRGLALLLLEHGIDKVRVGHVYHLYEAWKLILGLEIMPFKRGPLSDRLRVAEPPE